MHRVELKVFEGGLFYFAKGQEEVPNAPCGVERSQIRSQRKNCGMFLMHRVELKASKLDEFSVFNHSS